MLQKTIDIRCHKRYNIFNNDVLKMLLSPKSVLLRWHGGISHEQKEFRGTEKRKQPTENHIFRINYGTVIFSRIVYHDYFKGKSDLLSRIWSGIFNFFLCADEQRNAATVSEVKRRKRRAWRSFEVRKSKLSDHQEIIWWSLSENGLYWKKSPASNRRIINSTESICKDQY